MTRNCFVLPLVCLCLGVHAQPVGVDEGLAAWWSFDEVQDELVTDRSGNGNDGRLVGGAELVPGIRGQGLNCNGEDAHVVCTWDSMLNSPTALTVEAWIYPQGAHQNGYGGIINNLNGAGNCRLLINNAGVLLAQLHGSKSGVSGATIVADLWNHVAYTFDGREEVWYLNGERTHSAAYTDPLPSGSAKPTIGWGYGDSGFYHFRGLIDEVRIHARALTAQNVAASYEALAGPVKAEVARREAERQREIKAMDFVNHGVPARLGTRRGLVATCDRNGRPLVLICSMDHVKRSLRSSLLVVDVLSGTTEQYWYPKKDQPVGEDYALLLAKTGLFYTMFGANLLEFDPTAREWTFAHRTPGMAMSFTEAPDGTIYSATFPGSHLVSFDPRTRSYKEHGKLDATEKYPRSLAVDDAGWVYCGIGVAKATLVAFDPRTGEKHRLPDDGPRKPGTASVFRAVNGKAYAYVASGGQCYELFEGKATPVPKPGAAKDPIKTASQSSFFTDFPDGRRVAGISLAEKWLDVTEPNKGPTRRITLTYESEGPGILSLISGPDGRVYGSTGLPLHFFAYDVDNDYLEDFGGVRHGAHYNGLAVQGQRIVGAAYCGGYLAYYDTMRPWTNEIGPTPNPVYLGNWHRDLTRPHALLAHPDGNHVIMGGTPAYGHCGGGLVVYNLADDTHQLLTHEQLIPDHSTTALAALPDGNLVGGTTTSPGTGGHAVAKEGALYLFDWATKKVVFQTHVDHATRVSEVVVGRNGLVYGFAGGTHFFVFDPKRREMVHGEDLGQYGSTAGGQAPRMLLTGPDGQFYALFTRSVVRIDPDTFKHECVLKPPISIGAGIAIEKGRVFFSSGAHLCSCRLPLITSAKPTTRTPTWTMLRSGPERDRTIVSLHCGGATAPRAPGVAQNALSIDVAGKWLVSGEGTPHAPLIVNGQGQTPDGTGRVLDTLLSAGYRYVCGEAADTYAPGLLSRFRRHLFSLAPDLFVVLDDVSCPRPSALEWRLPAGNGTEMTREESGVVVSHGTARLSVVPVGHADTAVRIRPATEGAGSLLAVSGSGTATKAFFRCVLRPQVVLKVAKDAMEMGRLPIVESSNREQRPIRGGRRNGIFFRAQEPGDFITFEVTVPEAGHYELVGCHYQSPLYGMLRLLVDGEPQGDVYDGYARGVELAESVSFGTRELSSGKHLFRYEVVGKNVASEGHLAGIISMRLMTEADRQDTPGTAPAPELRTRPVDTPTAVGVSVIDEDGQSVVVLSRAEEGASAEGGGCRFFGRHAAVTAAPNGEGTLYALHRGTQLEFGGERLVTAEKACSATVAIRGRTLTGLVKAPEGGKVCLRVPSLRALRLRGRSLSLVDVYNTATSLLTLNLQPGVYAIEGELTAAR
ncbi:MAG: hypothetical protein HN742_41680 [Lentisphaerae bacterium]|nr:hypothetical protein [Lentisphaerota bacterium]MBT5611714.1 hypothetical protein [Lentisphaerota bacterium]MBT7060446.1 hypothetical protein [Lentisphaerota bacterium]MBT7848449.1 hypothetical protein [Lentisphaerota bacterium]